MINKRNKCQNKITFNEKIHRMKLRNFMSFAQLSCPYCRKEYIKGN